MMPFQKEIDAAQAKVDLCSNEMKIFMSKSQDAEAKLKAAREDIAKLSRTILERQKRGKQITKELKQSEIDIKEKERELEVNFFTSLSLILVLGWRRYRIDAASRSSSC